MLKWLRSRVVATSWFVFITILFLLPGSALPKENWLQGLYLDKWVHLGFFAIMSFLFAASLKLRKFFSLLLLFFATVLYGLCIEFIQKEWIPNRSFDWLDLLADSAGSVVGILVWMVYKKNKPL